MGATGTTPRRGLWALVAAQPVSLSIVVLPFAIGLLGAAVVGLTVGFHATDDQLARDVRLWGPLLTGLIAGAVGRGLWGWVAASAGATLGVSPFFLSDASGLSIVLGAAIFSCVILAPGYALARAVAYALRLPSLNAEGRSAALRGPLRRILRVGVLLSGAGLAVAAEAVISLSEDANAQLAGALAILAAVGGSYVMYRLVDRLDRGDRTPARVFTIIYGAVGLGLLGVVLAAGAPVARAVVTILAPSSFMALAPWLLVRLVREQTLAKPQIRVEPEQQPAEPGTGPLPPSVKTRPGRLALRIPSLIVAGAVVGVTCLALVMVMVIVGEGVAPVTQSVVVSHDAPEVETLLPGTVAGRQLTIWSVRGEATLKLWGLTSDEISTTSQTLASMGVRLDDLVQATAGRADSATDPPYLVLAFRIPAEARDLLGGYAITSAGFTKETVDWQLEERVIGGKTIEVGPTDLLIQSRHQRGRPYLYGSSSLDTSFIVISDDQAWAEEAIRQLPE